MPNRLWNWFEWLLIYCRLLELEPMLCTIWKLAISAFKQHKPLISICRSSRKHCCYPPQPLRSDVWLHWRARGIWQVVSVREESDLLCPAFALQCSFLAGDPAVWSFFWYPSVAKALRQGTLAFLKYCKITLDTCISNEVVNLPSPLKSSRVGISHQSGGGGMSDVRAWKLQFAQVFFPPLGFLLTLWFGGSFLSPGYCDQHNGDCGLVEYRLHMIAR